MTNDVTSIINSEEISLITFANIPASTEIVADIFEKTARLGINVDMISQTAPAKGYINLSFTISDESFADILTVVKEIEIPELITEVNSNNIKICISGDGMKNNHGVAARIFSVLAKSGIGIKLITTAETEVSLLVDQRDADHGIAVIKNEFNIN